MLNFINGEFHSLESPTGKMHLINPATGKLLLSWTPDETGVEKAVAAATAAFPAWSALTHKARGQILFKFRSLCLDKYKQELIDTIVLENGKHVTDATASLLKGIETVEWAVSNHVGVGSIQAVSTGITCSDRRDPVGVIASICPFNFPAMVPLWTVPILLVLGNCVIVKPSEKVPLTFTLMSRIFLEAGLPSGVLSVVHGGASIVDALIAHRGIAGITFVGSSPVAELVYRKATLEGKRAICLGGAKNHLVLLADADPEMATSDILASFAGSAGQRCMAASVLVTVGSDSRISQTIELLVDKASKISPSQTLPSSIGPLIDLNAKNRVVKYIEQASNILLDGRKWTEKEGFWIGPTIISHSSLSDSALSDEIFGPVLSIINVPSLGDAIKIINDSKYGNAACVYTQSGPVADIFTRSVNVGMIGVNVGVPVPREPFSFGGTKQSKFGIGDITGDGLVEFGTIRRKITTKWTASGGDFVSRNFTG